MTGPGSIINRLAIALQCRTGFAPMCCFCVETDDAAMAGTSAAPLLHWTEVNAVSGSTSP
jgi:hypothetical protein